MESNAIQVQSFDKHRLKIIIGAIKSYKVIKGMAVFLFRTQELCDEFLRISYIQAVKNGEVILDWTPMKECHYSSLDENSKENLVTLLFSVEAEVSDTVILNITDKLGSETYSFSSKKR